MVFAGASMTDVPRTVKNKATNVAVDLTSHEFFGFGFVSSPGGCSEVRRAQLYPPNISMPPQIQDR